MTSQNLSKASLHLVVVPVLYYRYLFVEKLRIISNPKSLLKCINHLALQHTEANIVYFMSSRWIRISAGSCVKTES